MGSSPWMENSNGLPRLRLTEPVFVMKGRVDTQPSKFIARPEGCKSARISQRASSGKFCGVGDERANGVISVVVMSTAVVVVGNSDANAVVVVVVNESDVVDTASNAMIKMTERNTGLRVMDW